MTNILNLSRSFDKSYLSAIALIIALLITSNISLRKQIESNYEYSEIINLSGKQRMYSQRIFNLVLKYKQNPTLDNKENIYNLIKEIKASNIILEKYVSSIKVGFSLFEIKNAHVLLEDFISYLSENINNLDEQTIINLENKSTALLNIFETTTTIYTNYSKKQLTKLQDFENLFLGLSLILLLLIIFLIFVPMSKKRDTQAKELDEFNQSLTDKVIEKTMHFEEANKIAKLGIWEHDIINKTLVWSDEIYNLLKINKNEFNLSYDSFFDFIHPDDKDFVQKTYLKSIEEKTPYEIKHRLVMPDGEIKWVLEKCTTKFNNKDKAIFSIGIIQDITKDEKSKERELLLLEQSRMISMGQMIGNIAHQWRQPLTVISSTMIKLNLKYELNKLEKNDFKEAHTKIINSTNYLSSTIDTFRNFLNQKKEKKDEIIQNIIKESLTIISSVLEENNIQVKNNINSIDKIIINTVGRELIEVIINILNNAKDALLSNNIDNKWIEINLEKNDDKIIISIEDNAKGIPSSILKNIFEPYFTTKHKSQGTGLGLYMSHKIIIENLKGNLYVDNTKNGAKFCIELPY